MADLIISEGDCEFYSRCECGKELVMTKPNQSFDLHGKAWERHVMVGGCPIGPYDPEADDA